MDNTEPVVPETQTVNPVELEKAMLAQEEKKAQESSPGEVAATLFTLYLPRFFSHVDRLSNKDLRRLCKALVEHPLEDTPYSFHSDEAKEAFNLGVKLLASNYIMQFETYSGGLEELNKVANEIEVSHNETEGENVNGEVQS